MADNNLSSNKVQDKDLSPTTRGQDAVESPSRFSPSVLALGCDALAGSRILRERFGYV